MRNIIKLIALLVLSFQTIYSQDFSLQFDHITVDDGLSQGTILAMYQDSRGFIWFGTQDGLNRYDGYEFEIYRHQPENQNSLSSGVIQHIAEDSDGNLWIATERGGLNKFDFATHKFYRYMHDPENQNTIQDNFVHQIIIDGQDKVWVVSRGGRLARYIAETNDFKRYEHQPDDSTTLISDYVTVNQAGSTFLPSVLVDSEGILWLGTIRGLERYNNSIDGFIHHNHNPGDPNSLSSDIIISLFEDKNKDLWICTWGGGLNKYDRKSGKFLRYMSNDSGNSIGSNMVAYAFFDKKDNMWLSLDFGVDYFDKSNGEFTHYSPDKSKPDRLSADIEFPVYEDEYSRIWFTSQNGGLDILDPVTGDVVRHRYTTSNPDGLNMDQILTAMVDRSGVLWLGSGGAGLNKFVSSQDVFKTYRPNPGSKNSLSNQMIRCFEEDGNGDIWIGTAGGGLNKLDKSTGTVTPYFGKKGKNKNLPFANIFSIESDDDGSLWLATMGEGLVHYYPGSDEYKQYLAKSDNGLKSNLLRWLYLDDSGVLWIASDNAGLDKFDTKNSTFKNFNSEREETENATGISSNTVRMIAPSKKFDDILWIATDGGLDKFNKRTGVSKSYSKDVNDQNSLIDNRVMSVYEDNDGIVWIATFGGGLSRFDPVKEAFTLYTTQDGLPNNVLYGILEDEKSNLWISTNGGISKFTKYETGSEGDPVIVNFNKLDGLQGNEFNGGAFFKSSKGEMYFGGTNGFNSFIPQNIKGNPYKPEVVITDFKIFNESVPVTQDNSSPLSKDITQTDDIVLGYDASVITFEFAALHYENPNKNKYLYKLNGFEKEWRTSDSDKRFADYTNLSPGEYEFIVLASNNSNVWNKKGASVKLIIMPPWYQTLWAYFLYFVLLVAFIYTLNKIQRRRLINKEREKAQIREAELRAEAAELQTKAAEAQAKALESENQRKSHELEEARKIQLSMLPETIPAVDHLDIDVYMRTATEVGGDYYDFHLDENGALTIALGDATGHGLKAGTMVSVLKWEFITSPDDENIVDFFIRSNKTIKKMNLWNLYMALTLVRITNYKMEFVTAGMPPVLIYRNENGEIEEYVNKAMPLGAFDDFPYQKSELKLKKGDVILLLTDGITEQFNEENELLGYPKVKDILKSSHNDSPKQIIRNIISAGEEWGNNVSQNDDITLLVIKVK
ncbi:MAG: SpoIIE family protein phosphatase [Melioribacteraceae bacterium]|nr:SpoIIE family protein phosphatase [Melioribacteraceae bacterium]MCF8353844.1 SpoIIE family protein phosphatase [Melioribacteraceae bacterium]MCF8393077.1 SpoIIE family protein phosphatase [Melioribacteraceae bacterium]MCF8419196.1 SpoIIE family protein phosphatase [Melioribacteraceae bacterium]